MVPDRVSAVETEDGIKWFIGEAPSSWEQITYLRKDALLGWAKEKKKQLFEQESANDEPSDVAAGINAGLDMVIGKLNSM